MLKNAARDGKELPEIVSTCGVKIDRRCSIMYCFE